MSPLTAPHNSLLGLRWGRARGLGAAWTSAVLFLALVGPPAALAQTSGGSASGSSIACPSWPDGCTQPPGDLSLTQLRNAILFGYGNTLITLNLAFNPTFDAEFNPINTNTNSNDNSNSGSSATGGSSTNDLNATGGNATSGGSTSAATTGDSSSTATGGTSDAAGGNGTGGSSTNDNSSAGGQGGAATGGSATQNIEFPILHGGGDGGGTGGGGATVTVTNTNTSNSNPTNTSTNTHTNTSNPTSSGTGTGTGTATATPTQTNTNTSTTPSQPGGGGGSSSSSSSSASTGGGGQQQQQQAGQQPFSISTGGTTGSTGGTQVFTPPQQIFTPPPTTVLTPSGQAKTTVTRTAPPPATRPRQVFTPPAIPSVRRGTLPFTGSELTVFLVVGFVLLLGGALLRTTGRRTPAIAGEGPIKRGMPVSSTDPFEIRRRLALEAARLGGLTSGQHGRSSWDFPAPPR